jgi:hypothetical protein
MPPDTYHFTGKVVRIEADGFAIIKFENPIGPSSNNFGVVTSSTTSVSPLTSVHAGVKVIGRAEADQRDVASIKEFQIVSSRPTY